MIFDSHAHYDDNAFDADRDLILGEMAASGRYTVMDVGSDRASSEAAAALAVKYDFIYAAAGIHPSGVGEYEDGTADIGWLKQAAKKSRVLAIGEIGLDYHWPGTERSLQQKWFREQLAAATELDLPVIIHSRDAAQDTYDIMRELGGGRLKAVIHCFGYEKEMAARFIDLGYYLGVGGVLTYKNARKLKDVVQYMPLSAMLLETDCPYLTPVPFRGGRNMSAYLPYVIAEAAALRGETEEMIETATCANARSFYGL